MIESILKCDYCKTVIPVGIRFLKMEFKAVPFKGNETADAASAVHGEFCGVKCVLAAVNTAIDKPTGS